MYENKTINVGVIGCGVIGGALIDWLENNNKNVKVLKQDPPKGLNDDLSKADAIFISIHPSRKKQIFINEENKEGVITLLNKTRNVKNEAIIATIKILETIGFVSSSFALSTLST